MKDELVQLLKFYRKEYKVKIQGYVIMPEHLHIILNSEKGEMVKKFIQHFLKNSSKRIVSFLESSISKPSPLKGKNRFYSAKAEEFLNVFASSARGKAKHAVWKEKSKGIPVYTDRVMKIKLDYIHKNPLKRRLVVDLDAYIYSSYRNYYFYDHSVMEIDSVHCLFI